MLGVAFSLRVGDGVQEKYDIRPGGAFYAALTFAEKVIDRW
jgi:hypothetical protein